MSETFGPFDTGAGATFQQDKWQALMKAFMVEGIINGTLNELAVAAGSGMHVNENTGQAVLCGIWYQNSASNALTISTADATNSRIDLVVLHADLSAKTVAAAILTGTPAGSPTVPSLTQSSSVWEIALAEVLVHAGDTAASQFTITDRRAKIGPLQYLPNSYGTPQTVLGISNGDKTHAGKITLGSGTSEVHARASHNGGDTDVIQTVPDTSGSGPALIKVGGDPSQGIHVRLGNMSIFSGTGSQAGVAHGLGQTPSIIIISPLNSSTPTNWSVGNITSTTVDVNLGASDNWVGIAIAQA